MAIKKKVFCQVYCFNFQHSFLVKHIKFEKREVLKKR